MMVIVVLLRMVVERMITGFIDGDQGQQQRKLSHRLLNSGVVSSSAYMMSMDASAIQFQPTPTIAMPIDGGGSGGIFVNGFSST